MEFIDWIAVLGALAWLPHLIHYGHQFFSRSRLRLITALAPEIGFTTLGPILNLRLAFVVENKDLVISGMKFRLRHESEPEQVFAWQGISQTLGTFSNTQMGDMPFNKESNVLALKAKVTDVEERFVRFQNVAFLTTKQTIEAKASSRLMYLQRQRPDVDSDAFLQSDEMSDLCAYIKRSFPWKEGIYTITFEIDSPQSFRFANHTYKFTLQAADIEELEKNKAQIERAYRDALTPGKEGEPALVWIWRYPTFRA